MPNFTNSERIAFNEDLDRYMAKEVANDKYEEWVEEKTKELMDAEFSPFIPNNIQEAISEMCFADTCLLGAYVSTAARLHDNQSAQVNLADFVVRICNEYWEKSAKHHAEYLYDRKEV